MAGHNVFWRLGWIIKSSYNRGSDNSGFAVLGLSGIQCKDLVGKFMNKIAES